MRALRHTSLYVLLLGSAAVMLTPFVWLLAAAFKSHGDFFTYTFFAPVDRLTTVNFHTLFREIPYFRFMANSLFVAGTTVLLQLFFASLGGFALAKYNFRYQRLIMLMMLATLILPGEVLLAPLYELIYHLGLMDSHAGVIVPGVVSVFGVFLFRQAMLSIPDELLQAGRLDGCGEFGLYWKIALPVTRPMIGAFCLIAFMGTWNSFIWPQIILNTSDLYTLPIGVNQMVGQYRHDYGALMAGTLLSILPVVLFFFLLQREFITGLTRGAVQG
jgi:ABC-type glycerol-3-phosphate transport system permease component